MAEVIIALDSSVEGETTALYVQRLIQDLEGQQGQLHPPTEHHSSTGGTRSSLSV